MACGHRVDNNYFSVLLLEAKCPILKRDMSQDEFSQLSQQISQLDQRMDQMNQHMGGFERRTEERFEKLDRRIDDFEQRTEQRFNDTERRFTALESDISDLNASFLKLYQHMERRFNEFDAKLDTKADQSQMDRIHKVLDAIMARLDTEEVERAAQNSQLNRHEAWIQCAEKRFKIGFEPTA